MVLTLASGTEKVALGAFTRKAEELSHPAVFCSLPRSPTWARGRAMLRKRGKARREKGKLRRIRAERDNELSSSVSSGEPAKCLCCWKRILAQSENKQCTKPGEMPRGGITNFTRRCTYSYLSTCLLIYHYINF